MYMIFELEGIVGVHPKDFGRSLEDIVKDYLSKEYEGYADETLGFVIKVLGVNVDEVGYMLPRDPSLYHKVRFKVLTYIPQLQEVVEGEVSEITEFGAFVRIGPLEALLHISQITDDYLSFDKKYSKLLGTKTGLTLSVGDVVRARIVAVSLAGNKVGLTARQPYLGKLEWIKRQLEPEKKVEKARQA
ncbi:MAG: DNA-directed RNA polymerase [Nitrososphaerota archaeon]|nr:DNA-directed RNA polymerase [Nitrososphaerota archaeon]